MRRRHAEARKAAQAWIALAEEVGEAGGIHKFRSDMEGLTRRQCFKTEGHGGYETLNGHLPVKLGSD